MLQSVTAMHAASTHVTQPGQGPSPPPLAAGWLHCQRPLAASSFTNPGWHSHPPRAACANGPGRVQQQRSTIGRRHDERIHG